MSLIVRRPTTLESKATQAARGVEKAINFSLESCKPPFLSSCHITITWWMYFNTTIKLNGGYSDSSSNVGHSSFIISSSVAARQRKAAHTGGPLPKLGRWPPAVKKAISREQNHSARRKSQDFRPLVPWVFDPYPSDHFLAPNVKWRKEGALRRRRSSTLSSLYRDLGWE